MSDENNIRDVTPASFAAAAERDARSHRRRHDGGRQLDPSRRASCTGAATGGRRAELGHPRPQARLDEFQGSVQRSRSD